MPKKLQEGEGMNCISAIKNRLGPLGLIVKMCSDVKHLKPEREVLIGWLQKFKDGEPYLEISNIRFRIQPDTCQQGCYQSWCTSAASLFGALKPAQAGVKFRHQGVTVTIY